jgi:hypothetical protein
MKVTTDDQGRLTCAELFAPDSTFDARRLPDGTVRITKVAENDVPVVKSVLTKEGLMVSPVKVSRETIRAAIRADRDAR